MRVIKSLSVCLFLILITAELIGQKGMEIGGHIGIAHYFGDLNPNPKLSDPGFALGLVIRRNFNDRICLKGGVDYGRISGSDTDSNNGFEIDRNLSFKSQIFDFNAGIEFNFFPYVHGSEDFYYTPYIFTGFSVMKFNPKATLGSETYELRDLNTEGSNNSYGLLTSSWLYGIGFKWDYNRDWSFNVELSGRSATTDYLDDVSTVYPSYNELTPIGAALSNPSPLEEHGESGTQRGNSEGNDKVIFLNIGVLRYFGEIPCPKITRDWY